MNESKFTEQALDYITDYVALAKLKNESAKVIDCLDYLSEHMNFSISDINEAFGDLIESEIERVNAEDYKIDESVEVFSKSLLTEDANAETAKKVDNAVQNNKKSDITTDKQQTSNDSVRKYFVYLNLEKGQLYICSEAEKAGNSVNKALVKLNNFLQKCNKPVLSNSILVAPVSYETAKNYMTKFKGSIRYIDVTPEQKQKTNQNNNQSK